MTRAVTTAYRIRHGLFAAAVVSWLIGLYFLFYAWGWGGSWDIGGFGTLFTPVMVPVDGIAGMPGMWVQACFWLGVLLGTQAMLLRPGKGMSRRIVQGTPLRGWRRGLAVTASSFMTMILSIAALATLMEVPDAWSWVFDNIWPNFASLWAVMAVSWAAWGVLLWRYSRSLDEWTWLSRITRGLLAGSVAESMVAALVHAAVYQRDDCYCSRGSYSGMVLGGSVLLWAFGPALVLLYLRERRRRADLIAERCVQCGYDLRGSLLAGRRQCPECGTEYRPTAR